MDGGVIDEIYVTDGQHVKQGDVLARLSEPRLDAELTSLLNNVSARLCRLAKYQQLVSGRKFELPDGYELITDEQVQTYCADEMAIAKGLV